MMHKDIKISLNQIYQCISKPFTFSESIDNLDKKSKNRLLLKLSFFSLIISIVVDALIGIIIFYLGYQVNWGGILVGIVWGIVVGIPFCIMLGSMLGAMAHIRYYGSLDPFQRIALGISKGIAWGITFGIAGGITFGIGTGIYRGIGGIAGGIAFGFLTGITGGILGTAAGFLTGIAGGIAVGFLMGMGLGISLGIPLSIAYLFSYFRVFYILPHLIQYLRVKVLQHKPFSAFRNSPIYWDEVILMPLPFLSNFLVTLANKNRNEGLKEIEFVSSKRPAQRKAAASALLEITIQDLSKFNSIKEIAEVSKNLSILSAFDSSLFKEFSNAVRNIDNISIDAKSYLESTSNYNKLIKLNLLSNDVDKFKKTLIATKGSVGYRFLSVADKWSLIQLVPLEFPSLNALNIFIN